MEFLLGKAGWGDIRAVAKRYLFEWHRSVEMDYHTRLATRLPIDRFGVLRDAHTAGKGVILNNMHHGYTGGIAPAIARRGLPIKVGGAAWFYTEHFRQSQGPQAMRGKRRAAIILQPGVKPFNIQGSFNQMCEWLRQGYIIMIASDMPGHTTVTWLGRQVNVGSGAARLAVATGAPIVPITCHRNGLGYRYRVEDPFSASPDDDFRGVLAQIYAAHEPAVRAWPEAVERPLRRYAPVTEEDVARFGYDPSEYYARFVI
jgi:lauroyl/myristoyl acyltransferase